MYVVCVCVLCVRFVQSCVFAYNVCVCVLCVRCVLSCPLCTLYTLLYLSVPLRPLRTFVDPRVRTVYRSMMFEVSMSRSHLELVWIPSRFHVQCTGDPSGDQKYSGFLSLSGNTSSHWECVPLCTPVYISTALQQYSFEVIWDHPIT